MRQDDLTDELTLDEMLADPIVRLLMDRDGVEEDHVRRLMAALRPRPDQDNLLCPQAPCGIRHAA